MKKTLFAVISALLFASCSFWNEPVEEFFSYWSSEAFITDSSVKVPNQSDKAGVPSVSSDTDSEVILKMSNPKSFRFIMPSAGNTEMIRFKGLEPQPSAGTDYKLEQISSDTLKLTYSTQFLKKHEWGNGDLGATLTLFADDGRKFKKPYGFNLKANTPPPTPTAVLAQTTASSFSYVLCFKVPDMGVMVNGERLHKDIAQIEINGTKYPLTVESSDFKKPDDPHFILAGGVTQLTEPHSAPVPAGAWVLYYNTGVPLGAGHQAYTVKLKDDKDLVSNTLETGTTLNEPPAENVTVTAGEQSTGSGTDTDPFIIKGAASAPEAQIKIENTAAGTTVHCTVTEVRGTAAPARYDGNPVTFPLGLGSANEKTYKVEYYTDGIGYKSNAVKTKYYKVLKQHTVTFNANGGAYSGGATTRTALVPHTMTVTAPAATDNPTRTGYTFGSWYKEAACTTQWNFATDTVNDDTTLYAQWNPASGTEYKVKHYQENLDGTYPSTPTDIESRTGQTDHTFTAAEINGMKKTTYQGFEFDKQELNHPSIKADGSTIIKLFYKRKTVTLTFNLNGGNIGGSTTAQTRSGRFGTTFTAPTNPVKTGYTFSGWQPTPPAPALSSTFPTANAEYTAKWTANIYTVRFSVYGGTGGTLKANPEGGTEKTTSTTDTVSVEHGKKVTFTAQPDEGYEVDSWTGATADTPNTTATLLNVTTDNINVTVKFKKKVYTVTFSVEGGEGSLRGEGGGSINTADGSTPVHLTVPYGENVDFTATPKSGVWKVAGWMKNNAEVNGTSGTYTLSNVTENTTVKVRFYQSEITGTAGSTTAWRDLLSAVRNAPANATIKINGEIKATTSSGNNGEIIIDKDLTIEAKTGTATLDANEGAFTDKKDKHRIFHVKDGKTLTLKNLTLTKGAVGNKAAAGGYGTRGGGILLESGTVSLSDVIISGCRAITDSGEGGLHGNGAGIYVESGTVTMENTTLSANIADAYGGAVYLKGGTLTMKGSTVVTPSTGGDANKRGKNDVLLFNGAKIILDGALTGSVPVARITVGFNEYLPTRQVLDGRAVASNNTKFTVTDQELGTGNGGVHVRKWKIASNGCLQSEEVTLDGSKTRAWQALKDAVRTASDGDVIAIDGTIKATNLGSGDYVDNGEILVTKNITIKAKSGTATLDADKDSGGKPKHRIFKVASGKTLTLENLTLTGGIAETSGDALGGGIYSEGTLTLNNTTIESCGAKNGGGIYAQGGAEITLTNTEINSCVAEENGGGLYIKDSRLTLTNAAIGGEQLYSDTQAGKTKGNKAKNGGGIFLTGSGTAGSRMTGGGGKVSFNLATDGTYAKGGGIYIEESASFTMQSGNINSNEVRTGTVEDGGGVYVRGQGSGSGSHASFTLNRGTIGDNYAGFGGGVMVTAGGSCTMKDGTISRNRANYGGGVCAKKEDSADGVFTMKNGTITGNRAYQDGGAVEVHGVFTWEGGSITGNYVNTAPRGQIIHKDGGNFYNPHHYTAN